MQRFQILLILTLLAGLFVTGCDTQTANSSLDAQPNGPSKFTNAYNKAYSSRLNWQDTTDFTNVARGFIGGPVSDVILSSQGDTVWNFNDWKFLSKMGTPSPDSVNASLWRISKLNSNPGLYEVIKGSVYQIRGYDLAVMSLIIADSGYIVIDPLTSPPTAQAGLQLFKDSLATELEGKPLMAMIYTHSHIDHFGGAAGILLEEKVSPDDIKIYAPTGFLEAAVSENVDAGNVMGQRAAYMYGDLLPRNSANCVGSGLGQGISTGVPTLIAPNRIIDSTGTKLSIAGTPVEFLYAPHTEAPAEMLFYFPELKALCAAEDASQNLHNLYSLRGTKTRDAKEWVNTLTSVLELWGNEVEVEFNSHHWPVWDNDTVKTHIETQRAMYKYIHDQTLHYANKGYNMTTVAEILSCPPQSLNEVWSSQGYYGTYNHDVKATWDLYLGWFDGNPSNLHKLPDYESSPKYVEFMGGSTEILNRANKAYALGEYRWVAEVVQHVINTEPDNQEAKYLVADAYEQMGYQAVSGPWRNFYLTGAMELREGRQVKPDSSRPPLTFLKAMTPDMRFGFLSIMVDAYKAEGKEVNFALVTTGSQTDSTAYQLKYSCLNYLVDSKAELDFVITADLSSLNAALVKGNPFQNLEDRAANDGQKRVTIDYAPGGRIKFAELKNAFSPVDSTFNIVVPNYPIPEPVNPLPVKQR